MKKKKKIRMLVYGGLAVLMAVAITTSFVRAANVEYTTIEVVVQEGDTLWGIWEEVGYGRADKWIHEVKSMNEKDLSVLMPYDRITVPVVIGN